MKLYLIQHGLALQDEDDSKRVLSPQGSHETHKISVIISESGEVTPVWIFHSPKTRAKQTAVIFAEALDLEERLRESDGLKPNDDINIWLNRIKDTNEDIMLVGHLPHLQKLCSQLLTGNPDKNTVIFKNSGVVCMERSDDCLWSLLFYVNPDIL